MKKYLSIIAVCIVGVSTAALAECPVGSSEEECMTVAAPKITEGSGSTTTVGGIIGNPSGLSGSGSPATKSSINTKGKKTAKDAKDKKENENDKDENSLWDWLLGLFAPEVAVTQEAIDKIKEIGAHVDRHKKSRTIKRDPQTGHVIEETETSECWSGGINDKKPSCTELQVTPYQDPSDGKLKNIITISEVQSMPNPKKGLFEPKYIFKYINSFQLVVENEEDVDNFFQDLWYN